MRGDQRVDIIFIFTILLFLVCVCVTQMYPETQIRIREGSIEWDQFFEDPYEVLIFIFKDQQWISFDTQEEGRINLHPLSLIHI